MAALNILSRPCSIPQVEIACCSTPAKQSSVSLSRNRIPATRGRSPQSGDFAAWQTARRARTHLVLHATGKNSGDGDSTSKAILDAFFLGKALAETVNERIGTALGEILSEIGKQQAEQRDQVRQFQEEVKERAEAAKQKAARAAAKEEGLSTVQKQDIIID